MTHLQKYIQAALKRATYTFDHDTQTYIGVVADLPVCWAQGETIEDAREELESVIEGWILLSVQRGEPIPSLGAIQFSVPARVQELQYA